MGNKPRNFNGGIEGLERLHWVSHGAPFRETGDLITQNFFEQDKKVLCVIFFGFWNKGGCGQKALELSLWLRDNLGLASEVPGVTKKSLKNYVWKEEIRLQMVMPGRAGSVSQPAFDRRLRALKVIKDFKVVLVRVGRTQRAFIPKEMAQILLDQFNFTHRPKGVGK